MEKQRFISDLGLVFSRPVRDEPVHCDFETDKRDLEIPARGFDEMSISHLYNTQSEATGRYVLAVGFTFMAIVPSGPLAIEGSRDPFAREVPRLHLPLGPKRNTGNVSRALDFGAAAI